MDQPFDDTKKLDLALARINELERALMVFLKVLRGESSYVKDSYELHVSKAEYSNARAAYDRK